MATDSLWKFRRLSVRIGRSAQGGHGWRQEGLHVFIGRKRFFVPIRRTGRKP